MKTKQDFPMQWLIDKMETDEELKGTTEKHYLSCCRSKEECYCGKQETVEEVAEKSYTKEDLEQAHQQGAIFAYGRKESTRTDRLEHFEQWFENLRSN